MKDKKIYMDRMKYYDASSNDEIHLEAINYVNNGDRVLSCGCGSGREVNKLNSLNCQIIAIDNDLDMINSSIELGFADYLLEDFSDFKRNNYFDKILCLFNTLPFLNNTQIDNFIENSYNNLKEEGLLLITFRDKFANIKEILKTLIGINWVKITNREIINKLLNKKFQVDYRIIKDYTLIIAKKVNKDNLVIACRDCNMEKGADILNEVENGEIKK